MLIEEIKYVEDSYSLFNNISDDSYAILLDSNHYANLEGQFDIITAYPETVIITFGKYTKIIKNNKVLLSYDNVFEIIKKYLPPNKQVNTNLPFIGGAIGYLGYDLAYQIHKLPKYIPTDCAFPDMIFGIYNWSIISDHKDKKTFIAQYEENKEQYEMIKKIIKMKTCRETRLHPVNFQSNISFNKYAISFKKVKTHIKNGDCYQVNLSQRFEADNKNKPWEIYKRTASDSHANFAAYFNTDYGQIICQSPERFIKIKERILETNPIKGTIKKQGSDLSKAYELQNSKKNRAENLMIVDLLRNDLHRSCKSETIYVDKFCEILTLQTLFHLESKVTGCLIKNLHPLDAIKYAFPGGSITGAPKLRAMQISESVEFRRRNIFCGSLVYISNNGHIDSNIMIRTLLARNNKLFAWAGGGIVAESTLCSEYAETINKLDNIFEKLR